MIWEEKNSTEHRRNCVNNQTLDPNVITKETNLPFVKSECGDIGKEWKKLCPECGREQFYGSKHVFVKATIHNKICKKCTQNKNRVSVPPDGWIRKCPDCKNMITYVCKGAFTLGTKRNKLCDDCQSKKRTETVTNLYFRVTRQGAKIRGLDFKISKMDMVDTFCRQHGKCALTGKQLTFAIRRLSGDVEGTASLDRIDSSKGYIKDNVQWVHKDINKMKGTFSQSHFIEWCDMVSSCNKRKN